MKNSKTTSKKTKSRARKRWPFGKTLEYALPKTVAQPVVILPLTEEKMQQGKKKDLTHSIRWLGGLDSRKSKSFSISRVYRDKPLDQSKTTAMTPFLVGQISYKITTDYGNTLSTAFLAP